MFSLTTTIRLGFGGLSDHFSNCNLLSLQSVVPLVIADLQTRVYEVGQQELDLEGKDAQEVLVQRNERAN